MAELNVHTRRQVRPDSVYMAVVLWWSAAGLTMVPALISLYDTLGRVSWDDVPRLLVGFVLGVALVVVAITRFDRGQPVARIALTGLAVYYTWILALSLSVMLADKSQGMIIVFLIEVARTACAIVAAILSWNRTSRRYFQARNTQSPATRWIAWLWWIGIAAIALQFAVEFIDSLPGNGRSWTRWASGSSRAIGDALTASFLLCLMPAYASIVQQFRYTRQWARVMLTVFGALAGTVAVLQVLSGSISAVLAAIQVLATAAAIVWSYLPAVNAEFRNA